MGIWSYFAKKNNRELWAFFGGGFAVVVGALWAIFTFTHPQKSDPPPPTSVSADHGGVAGGRDVTIYGAPIPPQVAQKPEAIAPETKRKTK